MPVKLRLPQAKPGDFVTDLSFGSAGRRGGSRPRFAIGSTVLASEAEIATGIAD
jgi:hypothetical protein